MAVSICIPTFQRPELLEECIKSCFRSSLRPLEIVVSDDDADETIREKVSKIPTPHGVSIIYIANADSPGQAGNVKTAFRTANYEQIILMHDDDFFLPKGIDHLWHAWQAHGSRLDAVYGYQCVCDHAGRINNEATLANNRAYFRSPENDGLQKSSLRAALLGQFPNNGYIIRRTTALEVGYPDETEVGRHPVDHHFGIRYALATNRSFLLIPQRTTAYRRSTSSIERSRPSRLRPQQTDAELGWKALTLTPTKSKNEEEAKNIACGRVAPTAISSAIHKGDIKTAINIVNHKSTQWPRSTRDIIKAILFYLTGAADRVIGRSN